MHCVQIGVAFTGMGDGPTPGGQWDWGLDFSVGWRVLISMDGGASTLDMRFTRKRDAEAAATALRENGLATAEAFREAGGIAVRRIIIEALAW